MNIVKTIQNVNGDPSITVNIYPGIEVGAELDIYYVGDPVSNGVYKVLDGSETYIDLSSYNSTITHVSWAHYVVGIGISSDVYRYTYDVEDLADGVVFYKTYEVNTFADAADYQAVNDAYLLTVASGANGIISDYKDSPWVSFNSIEPTASSTQGTRNDRVGVVYNIKGQSLFSVGVYSQWYLSNISSGPTITFDLDRVSTNPSDRQVKFYDTNNNTNTVTVETVQLTADPTAFDDNYNVDLSGNLTITPTYKAYDNYASPSYRIYDTITELPISALTAETLPTTTITGMPLVDLYLDITDIYGSYYRYTLVHDPLVSLSLVKDVAPLSLSNDPMVVIWDSTVKEYTNTRYYFRLLDDEGEEVLNTAVYPDIDNSLYGIYNMNIIYNNYTTTDVNFSGRTIKETDNVYEYAYAVSDLADNVGITSDTKYAIKGATTYEQDFNINEYIGECRSTLKFLTTWKGDRLFKMDDYATVNIAYGNFTTTPVTGDNYNAVAIIKYTANDVRGSYDYTDTSRVNFIITLPTIKENEVFNIPYGPKNFDEAVNDNAVTDDNGIIVNDNFLLDDDALYYEMHLVDRSKDFPATEWTTIKLSESVYSVLDKNCTKRTSASLLWRDKLGNYNTFTFDVSDVKSNTFSRNSVTKDYFGLNVSEWSYNKGDRGRSNVNVRQNESHFATSGWLNDDLSTNIIDLYASNDVYVIKGEEILPIIITSNVIEEKNTKNNRLFNHNIAYEMAYDINTNE